MEDYKIKYDEVIRHMKLCFIQRSVDEWLDLCVDKIYIINGIVLFN